MTTHPAQDSAGSAATGVAEDWHAAADREQLEEFGLPSEPDMPTIETQDRMALIEPVHPETGEIWPEFWLQHPVLTRVFVSARDRNVAPMALLATMLALAGCAADHRWRIVIDRNPSPVTLFVAVIGFSGAGKSKSIGAAFDLIPSAQALRTVQPTHLAGMIDSFGEMIEVQTGETDTKGRKRIKLEWRQTRHSVLLNFDEIERLARVAKRFDDELFPGVRTGWSGGKLETSNVKAGSRYRSLAGGAYVLSMLSAGTPETAEPWTTQIVAKGDGDRVLLISGVDGSAARLQLEQQLEGQAADGIQFALHSPEPLSRSEPSWPVQIHDEIVKRVIAANRDRNRGVRPESDDWMGQSGHSDLMRLRVAACWSLLRHAGPAQTSLDGKSDEALAVPHPLEITDQDFVIAGTVMAFDASTRDAISAEISIQKNQKRLAARSIKAADAEAVQHRTDDAVARRLVESAVNAISRKITRTGKPISRRDAARVLDSGARKRFGEVTGRQLIDDALADGAFVELEQENGKRQFDVDPKLKF